MDWHPYACVPPMLSDEEMQSLAVDIRENGLKYPIVRYAGKVLDGRNRLTACTIAGVAPEFVDFEGSDRDALRHARSLNECRRHESSGQRAVANAKYTKFEEGIAEVEEKKAAAKARQRAGGGDKKSGKTKSVPELIPEPIDNGEVRDQRAKEAGTNPKYIDDADGLVDERPDLADKVLTGEMSLPQAKRVMKKPNAQKRREFNSVAAVDRLRKLFDRESANWPRAERKKLVHFWKQVADEVAGNDRWMKGEQ